MISLTFPPFRPMSHHSFEFSIARLENVYYSKRSHGKPMLDWFHLPVGSVISVNGFLWLNSDN